MTILSQLSKEETELIDKHNAASKLNKFFYNNQDAHLLFKEMYVPKNYTEGVADRFDAVYANGRIERELFDTLKRFEGKKCILRDTDGTNEIKTLEGVIDVMKAATSGISFRWVDNDICDVETIALWVNTGSKYSTHLYTIDKIELA